MIAIISTNIQSRAITRVASKTRMVTTHSTTMMATTRSGNNPQKEVHIKRD